MKARSFLRVSCYALAVLSLVLLAGCAVLQNAVPRPVQSADQAAVPGADPATGTTSEPAHKAFIASVMNESRQAPADWSTYESPELGIQFSFPPLAGETRYEYNDWSQTAGDPSGTLVEWQVTLSDPHWTYTFAALESDDMAVGRERWFTDILRWFYDETAQKYFVVYGGAVQPQVEVQPLLVITRSNGTQGIIFTPDALGGQGPRRS